MLTREQIVRSAIELLDAEGADGLSMRRLGARLGTAATAVYWHVKNKDDLIVLAGDAVFDEIELADPGDTGWREAAASVARETHAMITRHLWLVPAMGTHLIYGPGKARFDDHCLGIYEAAGFEGADADNANLTVLTFVLGTALGRAADESWRARLRRSGDEEGQLRKAVAASSEVANRFPRLKKRIESLSDGSVNAMPPEESFEAGLATILDGLETRLKGGIRPS